MGGKEDLLVVLPKIRVGHIRSKRVDFGKRNAL